MISRMSGGKPVLGTRVAVPVKGDEGYYTTATVECICNDLEGNEYVTVRFENNDKGEYHSAQIVGNGFKSIHDIKLQRNQKVYSTFRGKDICYNVIEHENDFVKLRLPEGNERDIIAKLEDVHLTESRYIPRLQEYNHEPDYRKIASVNSSPIHGKKRPVSASIEVPNVCRARKSSAEPTMDELMAAMVLSNLSSSPIFHNPKSPSTKKDSSPHSFGSSGVGSWGQEAQMSPVHGEHILTDHSFVKRALSTPERNKSVIQHTKSIEHSPSSTGDSIEVDTSGVLDRSMAMDEDVGSGFVDGVIPPGHSTPAPFYSGSPRLQEYTNILSSSPSQNSNFLVKPGFKLESVKEEPNGKEDDRPRSVPTYGHGQPSLYFIPSFLPSTLVPGGPDYLVHMQSVQPPSSPIGPADDHSHLEMSSFQHQPQFTADVRTNSPNSNRYVYIASTPPNYYTIPVRSSSPLNRSFVYSPATHAPSPLASQVDNTVVLGTPYPDAKQSSHPVRITGTSALKTSAQPINIPGMKAFSWHGGRPPQNFSPKPSILRQRQMHQATSPKMSFHGARKVRGDGKKCRKVYGMENRDLWCTACRWKKACQRFPD